ncbi:phosphate butyryltransferase [Ornithinibacillus halophilus]|uniref:Phosphate butyryltransferase n=1 Tax=Ornithinibacillus halophilus TaxID=930117 RepID=A0A1M5CXM7_9BACI|nr:phosphate butyryltransferase [Ornithinibacillus halophilus]SHF59242.1 phosphate butyryltransferase [Ornithinibacillus halophilus]
MKTLTELKESIQQQEIKHIVAVANAAEQEVLQSIKSALKEELCKFLLFGDKDQMNRKAQEIGLDLNSKHIQIRHEVKDVAGAAVKAVHDNEAHIVMKGNVSTKQLLKAVLNKDYGLRSGNVLSHVALFEVPNQEKLIFLTDAAMNVSPSLHEKKEIIQNAVKVAHSIGVEIPKVAAIAPVEVINEAMESTTDAAILTQMNRRGQIKGCLVDGPLGFDNAVSKTAARQKEIDSEVAGDTDIILVPTIEVGNALYKSFVYFANSKVAAIISGAKAPIVLTSRADSAESKLLSLSLALKTLKNN